jgi:endoglucanase
MNEPHDLNVGTWAATVQQAVNAIRSVSSTSHMILLPGTDFTAVGAFINNDSGPSLSAVKNPDGSTTNLIFDVHQYLDSDSSGRSPECTQNGVNNLNTLGNWLRSNGRQA